MSRWPVILAVIVLVAAGGVGLYVLFGGSGSDPVADFNRTYQQAQQGLVRLRQTESNLRKAKARQRAAAQRVCQVAPHSPGC